MQKHEIHREVFAYRHTTFLVHQAIQNTKKRMISRASLILTRVAIRARPIIVSGALRPLAVGFSLTPAQFNYRLLSSTVTNKPMVNLSSELAAVVGSSSMTRQEALKGVWAYIKANNLQDPIKKREIVPDEKLRAVFGKDRATMYEVMKLMSPHMTKM